MRPLLKENLFELIAIIIVFSNIFITIIPPLPLVFLLIAVSFIRLGIVGAFVLSSFALPKVLGAALYTQGIVGVATIVQVLLFTICLFLWLFKNKLNFYNYKKGFIRLLIILFLFAVSSWLSTGGDYAIIKVKDATIGGIVTFFSYGFLFSNNEKSSFIRIGLYFILFSLLMLTMAPLLNNGVGPEGFLDFGYLRAQNTLVLDEDQFLIDYQLVGFTATMGLGVIMLEQINRRVNIIFTSLCLVLCIIISLYSGARQFMIISLALLLIWALSARKKGMFGFWFFALAILLGVFLVGFLFAEGGMLNSVQEVGYLEASNRGLNIMKGINDFVENPLFGVGFGRFEIFGQYGSYPHNMFVEILCELGIFGFIVLTVLSINPVKYLMRNALPCIYLLVVYFMRSMTSGGLDSNIMLFSFLFSVYSIKQVKRIQGIK